MQNCRQLVQRWQLKLSAAPGTARKPRMAPKYTLPAGEYASVQLKLPAAGIAGNFHATLLLTVHTQNTSFLASFSWSFSEFLRKPGKHQSDRYCSATQKGFNSMNHFENLKVNEDIIKLRRTSTS